MTKDYNWRQSDWTNPEDYSAATALDYKKMPEVSLGGHTKEFFVSNHYFSQYGINTTTPKENRRYFVTTIKKELS